MFPHERSLVEKYKDKPFALIGVNSDESREKLKQIQQEQNLTWRSFFDGGSTNGPIATMFNVEGWPTIYLLDKDHKIRWVGHGGPDLDKVLEELIAEAEAAPPPQKGG